MVKKENKMYKIRNMREKKQLKIMAWYFYNDYNLWKVSFLLRLELSLHVRHREFNVLMIHI